ncbi:MAG TPA: ATP-binding protein [Acetobacteraceae bacterium]|nr:ATP-binding protein [Acetobacteraceae bacterium]
MPSEALLPLAPELPAVAGNVVPMVPLDPAGAAEARPTPEERVFVAAAPCDVQDLVEAPCRALETEYKSWRNLDHAEDRAELARDIAALANHGGGFIVFGFEERSLAPDDTDPFRTNCTTERIGTIVRTYLDPPVRCEVVPVLSSEGVVHPVVRVAGHGATPVCIRQDGPVVAGTKLVERGVYYIRKHGPVAWGRHIGMPAPQSARIEVPQDWAALIRRCVRRDREALLGMLEAAMEGRSTTPDLPQRLLTWHRAARAAFLPLVPRSPTADNLARRHYALSYGFEQIRPESLEQVQLADALRRTVFEVQSQFRSGWNMFDPPYRRAVQARFVVDPASGDDEADFLEAAWLRDRNPGETADFWRVSPRGMATIIRGYAEDMTQAAPLPGIRPGTCLSPTALTQEVAELVCHARAFARLFSGVRRVAFRCEWWGLAGRELFDTDARWAHRGPALDDRRVATAQVPLASLAQAWPEVVAMLIAPVLRAFEPDLVLDADWVRTQAPKWLL